MRLARDEGWELRYRNHPDQSYGWDVALAGGHAWFMDNGEHDYVTTMLGARDGSRSGAPRARVARPTRATTSWCRSAARPGARSPTRRCSTRSAGSRSPTTRPTACWRPSDSEAAASTPLWQRPFASAGHLLLFGDTGELVAYDFHALPGARTRLARAAGRRGGARLVLSPRVRRLAARLAHEDVLVLDVETGVERGRASVPSLFQSVLFPCPGWNRDVYYCSFSTVARIAVTP